MKINIKMIIIIYLIPNHNFKVKELMLHKIKIYKKNSLFINYNFVRVIIISKKAIIKFCKNLEISKN